MVIGSFVFFLFVFVLIGVMSAKKRQETTVDYLLASQNVKPWLVGLSAIATTNSGYMFVGQIGFTYQVGLSSIWLMIGWIAGDFITSLFVHKKLRKTTEKRHALSFAGVISKWHGEDYKYLRIVGGLVTLAFLGTYAAAQLNAGSKALHVLFDWNYAVGAVIGALIVLLYCFAGGIRASIWTDAAQSFVMLVAMLLMMGITLHTLGGWSAFIAALHEVSPTYMNLFPPDLPLGGFTGPALFVTGWFFAGVGVVGQPHIMVRFMAMDDAENIWKVRGYYYSWYVTFYTITILTALAARLLLPEVATFDAELALPTLAQDLLPSVLVGLVLAGLFAATMSTADSQILSCTAAIAHDFSETRFNTYLATKMSTVFVTLLALAIALSGNESVFALVLIAWSALAAAFAPLLIVFAFRQKVTEGLGITMMLGGIAAVLLWRHFGLGDVIYEIAPGIMAGLLIFVVGKAFDRAETVARTASTASASR